MGNRTTNKDILMICKIWYNTDKHKSVVEALRAYCNHLTAYGDDYTEYPIDGVLHFLMECANEFLSKRNFVDILTSTLVENYSRERILHNRVIDLYENIIESVASDIRKLQVKKDDIDLIDLSVYDFLKPLDNITGDWWETENK